ncbi:unnamed protein product [Mycena citricolor]|uniref:AB hydrolase-1 domain-containing protein n=1 Tax=Mycena citricolor TaxID=2018698 RepID=A0AAD2H2E9_9AGAR|nr:unnamed protein product [Mycena citricolor]CAK5283164.1 unnamed protein product [Mycena citricolor]
MALFTLPDGASISYEVLSPNFLGAVAPLILLCGMGMAKADWRALAPALAQSRPVLVYDHRGIGDSTHGSENITISRMARDLVELVLHLRWNEVALCGYSMGGVVAQQLLVFPLQNLPLPFRVTHVFLISTRSVVLQEAQYGLQIRPTAVPRTPAQRMELIRRTLEATFDPAWLGANPVRFENIVQATVHGRPRPPSTIEQQRLALQNFDFAALFPGISRRVKILVIHGQKDQVIPFRCASETLGMIKSAKFVQVGSQVGQVPSLAFGHQWFEYFDLRVWHDVFEAHLRS